MKQRTNWQLILLFLIWRNTFWPRVAGHHNQGFELLARCPVSIAAKFPVPSSFPHRFLPSTILPGAVARARAKMSTNRFENFSVGSLSRTLRPVFLHVARMRRSLLFSRCISQNADHAGHANSYYIRVTDTGTHIRLGRVRTERTMQMLEKETRWKCKSATYAVSLFHFYLDTLNVAILQSKQSYLKGIRSRIVRI